MSTFPTHRIRARQHSPAAPPPIDDDPDILRSFLSDAAHVPGGFAAGVAFPGDLAGVSALVASATRVLAVGAQSSLTGGATPRGELVVSTRRLTGISAPRAGEVRAGAGVPLADLQRTLAASGLYYPPVPTYDGAFVGGTVATNAAGAATFKYGTTRDWVAGLTVVLADGSVLDLRRGDVAASRDGRFELERPSGETVPIVVPSYAMPAVAKLSAGYFARPGMDLIDLFIGSEGSLGIIVDAWLKVIRRPAIAVALVECAGDAQAIAVTAALRREAAAARRAQGALDVAAVEYMDSRSLANLPDEAFARARMPRTRAGAVLLLVQIEVDGGDEGWLGSLQALLESCGVDADPVVAMSSDEGSASRLFALREAVPASVNATIGAIQARVHPEIQKTAGDMIVPFERIGESLALYRSTIERRGLDYAIWGHVSDGNLHPNIIPRSRDDVARGQEAILEIARGVVAMGGAPLAEHGVGRSSMKQQLLRELYGETGIDQMRTVKRALDPEWKLAPGVLFPV